MAAIKDSRERTDIQRRYMRNVGVRNFSEVSLPMNLWLDPVHGSVGGDCGRGWRVVSRSNKNGGVRSKRRITSERVSICEP